MLIPQRDGFSQPQPTGLVHRDVSLSGLTSCRASAADAVTLDVLVWSMCKLTIMNYAIKEISQFSGRIRALEWTR